MKENKFRGYSKEYKKWVYGDLITSPNGMIKYVSTNEIQRISDYQKFINEKTLDEKGVCFNNKIYEVDPDSIGQYINRKDKDGKEIYEGDIVNNSHGIWSIIYDTDNLCFSLSCFDKRIIWPLSKDLQDESEVIGNDYENPIVGNLVK